MKVPLKPRLHATYYASPPKGQSLDALIERLEDLGHAILEVDHHNNRIKIAEYKENT